MEKATSSPVAHLAAPCWVLCGDASLKPGHGLWGPYPLQSLLCFKKMEENMFPMHLNEYVYIG